MVFAFILKGLFFPLFIVTFAIVLGTILIEFINNFIKVSVHLLVSTSWVLSVGILYGVYPFLLFLPIVPILIWSRLTLKKHTVVELIAGGVLGSIITIATFLVGKLLYV